MHNTLCLVAVGTVGSLVSTGISGVHTQRDGALRQQPLGGYVPFRTDPIDFIFRRSLPRLSINKVRSIETLKGKLETKIKGTRLTLRKSLIVFQFIVAQ